MQTVFTKPGCEMDLPFEIRDSNGDPVASAANLNLEIYQPVSGASVETPTAVFTTVGGGFYLVRLPVDAAKYPVAFARITTTTSGANYPSFLLVAQ